MVTYLQLIYNLQQLPKPKHQEEKALSGDVLRAGAPSRSCLGWQRKSSQWLPLPCIHSPQHSCPPPWPCLQKQKQKHQQSCGCYCGTGTTHPLSMGRHKSSSGAQNNIWESKEVQNLGSLQALCEGASCSEGSSLKASWRPNGTMNVQQLWWELRPGMGSSRCDERHQSPMWVWAPFSRWEKPAFTWALQTMLGAEQRDHCRDQGQHRAPQGGAGREALHIPGPEGQLITLALEHQLTKVPR